MTTSRFTLSGHKGDYYVTIGLEVHAQIASQSKLFSSAPAGFGHAPNAQVSFVDAGFPGMLPVLNMFCVEQAVKTCLGLKGHINMTSLFDRKHYFYPDLPQGYQISQFFVPIMEAGSLQIADKQGEHKVIRINRLHIEQDAGKSLHDLDPHHSCIDLNRSGTGLMEIVSEPDLHSPEEAAAYVRKLRNLLVYLGTSDGNMEEGNLRMDVNVSVAQPGEPLGVRVEIKNLNSIRFMQQAIICEAERQIEGLEAGEVIEQETRLYDPDQKETLRMRSKEDAQQYRYAPDPDLPPLVLEEAWLSEIREALPELPDDKLARFQRDLGLPFYDADVLIHDLEVLAFFEKSVAFLQKATPKLLANWLITEVLGAVRRDDVSLAQHAMTPQRLVSLLEYIADGTLSGKMAKSVFEEAWQDNKDPRVIIEEKNLAQMSDEASLMAVIQACLAEESDKVAAYIAGQEKLFGYFIGQMMKKTKGRANPALLNALLKKELDRRKSS
ncbi:Asp-tRNA(Asn)/Glu-tRNA(Gln) amidotransferase subunit GatB [bacterium NHP-B]|nr:Asp-tRNA(Asn)/Glu-tRNA(Gln) amidotransferase subunit GatB [bacterium NHP-B]